MEYEIVNKYCDAHNLKTPVSKTPFHACELLSRLNEAATFIFPPVKRKLDYTRTLASVRLFERFLDSLATSEIKLDESMFEDFRSTIEDELKKRDGKTYQLREAIKAVDCIRYLINEYFYPRRLVLRRILGRRVYLKYQRFLCLSAITQKLILVFESDGRKVKVTKKYFEDAKGHEFFRLEIKRKAEKLSGCNRQSSITSVFTVLAVLDKTAIEDIEQKDLERFLDTYREKGKQETAKNYLAALFSIVANGTDLGILKNNPFDNFLLERRKIKSRRDFIMPDQMEKLLDLKLLNREDSREVRGRCLAVLLYDTGLRVSAMTKLRLEDLNELADSRYQLTVKGKYLKGDKEDTVFYILFQETRLLLKNWIHLVRAKLNPKTDHIFVSTRGKALTASGVRNIVYDCCRRLNIHTFKGKTPSPHIFRHTLATLNTEPYGKSLSPRLMQQRLGHTDFEIFEKIYVHNNPLAEMKEYKRLYIKDSKESVFDKVSKGDFFGILNSLPSVKFASIREVKEAYERKVANTVPEENRISGNEVIGEDEAVSALASLKVDYRSLRCWGLREGLCQRMGEKGRQKFVYDKARISGLAKNHIGSEEALRKFRGSRTEFYRRLKRCQTVIIGRRRLILKNDYLQFLIDDKDQYTIRPRKAKLEYANV